MMTNKNVLHGTLSLILFCTTIVGMEQDNFQKKRPHEENVIHIAKKQKVTSNQDLCIRSKENHDIAVPDSLKELLRSKVNVPHDANVISVQCKTSTIENLLSFLDRYAAGFNYYFKNSDNLEAFYNLLHPNALTEARLLISPDLKIALEQLCISELKKFFRMSLRNRPDNFDKLFDVSIRDVKSLIEQNARSACQENLSNLYADITSQMPTSLVGHFDVYEPYFSSNSLAALTNNFISIHNQLYVSSDQKYKVTKESESSFKLYDLTNNHYKIFTMSDDVYIDSISISPCANYIMYTSGLSFAILNIQIGNCIMDYTFEDRIKGISFSQNDKYLVGHSSKDIAIWELQTGRCIQHFDIEHAYNRIVISPCGNYIACMDDDEETEYDMELYDISSKQMTKIYSVKTRDFFLIQSCCFSPCSTLLAYSDYHIYKDVCDNPSISVFNTATKEVTTFNHEEFGSISTLCLSSDGHYLASCTDKTCTERNGPSVDQTIKIWDVSTGKCLHALVSNRKNIIAAIAFSPDNNFLLCTYSDYTEVYDISSINNVSHYFKHKMSLLELPLLYALSKSHKNNQYRLTAEQRDIFNNLGGKNSFGQNLRETLDQRIYEDVESIGKDSLLQEWLQSVQSSNQM